MTDIAPNRTLILDDVRYWCGQIQESKGYNSSVLTVGQELVAFDASGPMPALYVFEAPNSPPNNYESFGVRECFIDIQIVGHVRGATPEERKLQLDYLQADVHDAVRRDRKRDGWAVDTIQLAPTNDDAAVAAKAGVNANASTFVMTLRCRYYPDDDTEIAMAHGELYLTNSAVTNLAAPYTEVLGLYVVGTVADFAMSDVNGNPVQGRLRYTGMRKRWFLVQATGSLLSNAAPALMRFRIRKTTAAGVITEDQKTESLLVPSLTESRPFVCKALIELEQNDYLTFIAAGSGGSIAVTPLNFSATQVPKF